MRVEPEFRNELEAVLGETETISAFVEQAVRGAVNYRRTQAGFLARGEQAWQEYQRTGSRTRRVRSSTGFRSASMRGAKDCSLSRDGRAIGGAVHSGGRGPPRSTCRFPVNRA